MRKTNIIFMKRQSTRNAVCMEGKMRQLMNVACAVTIMLLLSGCMMHPISITAKIMEQKYKRDMEKQLRERVDYVKREQDLLNKKKEYEQKDMPLSLALTYAGLGEVYFRTFKFGQSLDYGEKGLQLIRQIESQKLENLNDDGQGKTLEDYIKEDKKLAKIRRQAAEIALYELKSQLTLEFNRKKNFSEAKKNIYDWLASNYRIVGDRAKEKELHSLSLHAQADLFNLTMKQTVFLIPYYQALAKKDASYLQTLEQMEVYSKQVPEYCIVDNRLQGTSKYAESIPEAAKTAQAEYMAKIEANDRLYHEIMKENLRGNAQRVEALIEEYSPDEDTSPASMMYSLKMQASLLGSESQAQQIEEYCQKHFNIPRSMIVKAWLFNEVGRKEKAAHLADEAVRIFSEREMPKIDHSRYVLTGFDPIRSLIDTSIPKPHEVPLAWRLLQASLLTDLEDERAVALWESIIRDVTEFNSLNRNDKTRLSYSDSRNKIVLNAYRRLSHIHEKLGNEKKAAICIDQVLQKRDSARATFSTESYKMGYLLENKDLYERYIALQGHDGFQNLTAMELAKSRAMADLMAERVAIDANEPLLKRIMARQAMQVVDLKEPTMDPTTRAIAVKPVGISEDIEKLKQTRPELYSLISVETLTREDLAALIPADTAVLSYYVADDYLYINLFQDNQTVLRKVAIPKMGVYSYVYDFRNAIQKKQKTSKKEKVGLDIVWKIDGQKEKLMVKNSMDFPIEIVNTDVISSQIMWQTIDTDYDLGKHRGKIDLLTKTIQPGKTETIVESPLDYASKKLVDKEIIIATNVGTFRLKGYLEIGSNGQWNVRETERSPTYWSMNKTNLFDTLITPVEEYMHARHLIIIPHGALHFLPFEALQDRNGKYLIEKYVVSYAPSISVLKYCKQKNTGRKTRLAAFGDPLGDLAFAKAEVNGLRDLFPESSVFTGPEVTLKKVLSNTKDSDVVHFACHGVFNADSPFDSALLLHGPNGTAQPLTVSRILGMQMKPYLVTLSACDTGLARISGGDELLGLVRGFFVAGSPSLATTLWPIDDKSTSLLMRRFYENLMMKNMNKAEALRDAKLNLIHAGHESPYYWAAFILQGDST
jgi:hypothetical protein